MSEFNPAFYTIKVRLQQLDGELLYVGSVSELADVEVYSDSYDEAYQSLLNVITDLKEAADASGKPFPQPKVHDDSFSGRISLRLPKSLHAKASYLAENEGVSLNQWLVYAISTQVQASTAVTAIKSFLFPFAWEKPLVTSWPDQRLVAINYGHARALPALTHIHTTR